jgi:hypothetical protein
VAGLVALPIIPLYLLAYRLLGKQAIYHWPETDVRPVGGATTGEFLFSRLVPLLLILAAFALMWLLTA